MPGLARLLLSPPSCRDVGTLRRVVEGRTVLVTGASFGIGEATARLLAEAGAEVLLLARTGERLHAVAGDIEAAGGRAHAYRLDLSRPEDIAPLVAEVERRHPRIDLVISNAGRSIRRPALAAAERRDLERSLAVNLTGPAALLLALLPRMVAQGGGGVVNVSTVSARPPAAPRWASYQGSKAGFDLWVRSVGSELRDRGVWVSSVYLPLVRTRMSDVAGLYRHAPALTPLEAAQAVAGAVVRPRERVAPWWLAGQELAALLLPGPLGRALSHLETLERQREGRG
ncbi:SDR family NAD(P)-dependent oxidoreductase [Deinococcus sp. YIM 134068]|uniref:SDR family NAD(P)-dependent oxidoreductase n=1 Tax=Deinococcus lichenicola TaxID=3118910 RepID=UPI002F9272F1